MTLAPTSQPEEIPHAAADCLKEIARKLMWWTEPGAALNHPARLVAQVMAIGTWIDVQAVRTTLGEAWFRRVLHDPPPGVFDEASWAYWHNVLGIHPIPPLPARRLP